jgi:hypothetical protein
LRAQVVTNELLEPARSLMRGFKVQAKAEIDDAQADIGRIQQCLDIYAQASARIRHIRDISSPEKELIIPHYQARTPTLDLLDKYAELLASTSSQLGNEVADLRLRLDRLVSHIQANEAAQQEHRLKETHLSISSSLSSQLYQGSTNVYHAISAAENSHQILVSTSGSPIHAHNITAGPRSSQWMGQMSEVSLQLFLKDVRITHCTMHNSSDNSIRN